MAEFEPYNEEWEREMMRLPKPVLIKLYKEACLRNNDNVPFDKPVKPESNGLLIQVPKMFYDSLIDCCNKILDAYESQDAKALNKYKAGLRILLNR